MGLIKMRSIRKTRAGPHFSLQLPVISPVDGCPRGGVSLAFHFSYLYRGSTKSLFRHLCYRLYISPSSRRCRSRWSCGFIRFSYWCSSLECTPFSAAVEFAYCLRVIDWHRREWALRPGSPSDRCWCSVLHCKFIRICESFLSVPEEKIKGDKSGKILSKFEKK